MRRASLSASAELLKIVIFNKMLLVADRSMSVQVTLSDLERREGRMSLITLVLFDRE